MVGSKDLKPNFSRTGHGECEGDSALGFRFSVAHQRVLNWAAVNAFSDINHSFPQEIVLFTPVIVHHSNYDFVVNRRVYRDLHHPFVRSPGGTIDDVTPRLIDYWGFMDTSPKGMSAVSIPLGLVVVFAVVTRTTDDVCVALALQMDADSSASNGASRSQVNSTLKFKVQAN